MTANRDKLSDISKFLVDISLEKVTICYENSSDISLIFKKSNLNLRKRVISVVFFRDWLWLSYMIVGTYIQNHESVSIPLKIDPKIRKCNFTSCIFYI